MDDLVVAVFEIPQYSDVLDVQPWNGGECGFTILWKSRQILLKILPQSSTRTSESDLRMLLIQYVNLVMHTFSGLALHTWFSSCNNAWTSDWVLIHNWLYVLCSIQKRLNMYNLTSLANVQMSWSSPSAVHWKKTRGFRLSLLPISGEVEGFNGEEKWDSDELDPAEFLKEVLWNDPWTFRI